MPRSFGHRIVLFLVDVAIVFCASKSTWGDDRNGSYASWDKRSLHSIGGMLPVEMRPNVAYGSPDDAKQQGDIFLPRQAEATGQTDRKTRLPAVLMIHGGAWASGSKFHTASHANRLASRGYVVFSINYRLAPRHKYPAQLDDCRQALNWLVTNADELGIDTDRLGVWGYSAGGHLASLLAIESVEEAGIDGPKIAACVAGSAPMDLVNLGGKTDLLRFVFGGTIKDSGAVYESASPIRRLRAGSPPFFLFHGKKDWIVPFESSVAMQRRLAELQVPHEFLEVPNRGHFHGFIVPGATARSFDFLDRHLKSDSTWLDRESEPQ